MTWAEVSGNGTLIAVVAFVLGALAAWRWRFEMRPAWLVVVIANVVAGVLTHVLTAIVLRKDPQRNITGVPLPAPFDEVATSLAIYLIAAGPTILGASVLVLFRDFRRASRRLWLDIVAVATGLYLTGLAPWAVSVLFD